MRAHPSAKCRNKPTMQKEAGQPVYPPPTQKKTTDLSQQRGRGRCLERTALRGRPPGAKQSGAEAEAEAEAGTPANIAYFRSADSKQRRRVVGSGARPGAARCHVMAKLRRDLPSPGETRSQEHPQTHSHRLWGGELQLCGGKRGGEFFHRCLLSLRGGAERLIWIKKLLVSRLSVMSQERIITCNINNTVTH